MGKGSPFYFKPCKSVWRVTRTTHSLSWVSLTCIFRVYCGLCIFFVLITIPQTSNDVDATFILFRWSLWTETLYVKYWLYADKITLCFSWKTWTLDHRSKGIPGISAQRFFIFGGCLWKQSVWGGHVCPDITLCRVVSCVLWENPKVWAARCLFI